MQAPKSMTRMEQPPQSCAKLIHHLENLARNSMLQSKATKNQIANYKEKQYPFVTISWDESHSLMELHPLVHHPTDADVQVTQTKESWTVYGELLNALNKLSGLKVHSLFLSTTGKISDFLPVKRIQQDPSK